jgi:hypothetical protein
MGAERFKRISNQRKLGLAPCFPVEIQIKSDNYFWLKCFVFLCQDVKMRQALLGSNLSSNKHPDGMR